MRIRFYDSKKEYSIICKGISPAGILLLQSRIFCDKKWDFLTLPDASIEEELPYVIERFECEINSLPECENNELYTKLSDVIDSLRSLQSYYIGGEIPAKKLGASV